MADINWAAIHQAHNEYKSKLGMQQNATPQPQQNPPAHAMILHAMSQVNAKPGEDHGSMIIRGMLEHLKRMTPDVSGIHKQPTTPAPGGR
jgi:hypothetical protein